MITKRYKDKKAQTHAHCGKFPCARKFSPMRIRENGNAEENLQGCAGKSISKQTKYIRI